jgi:signal-transduction protein with cAMP-binding, CBS, and nucleotidyltransferase domain
MSLEAVSSVPQLLNKLKIVWGLQDAEVEAFATKLKRYVYKTGDFIYKQNDAGDAVFVIENGTVAAITNMLVPTIGGSDTEWKDVFIKNLSTGDTSGFYSMVDFPFCFTFADFFSFFPA